MEAKIDMDARGQVTNRLRDTYRRGSKSHKGLVSDQIVNTNVMGRSTASRLPSGPRLADHKDQIDKRSVKSHLYGDNAHMLLEHVWMLMAMPYGKYIMATSDLWLALLDAAGDLDEPFATEVVRGELVAMSTATVDR